MYEIKSSWKVAGLIASLKNPESFSSASVM